MCLWKNNLNSFITVQKENSLIMSILCSWYLRLLCFDGSIIKQAFYCLPQALCLILKVTMLWWYYYEASLLLFITSRVKLTNTPCNFGNSNMCLWKKRPKQLYQGTKRKESIVSYAVDTWGYYALMVLLLRKPSTVYHKHYVS